MMKNPSKSTSSKGNPVILIVVLIAFGVLLGGVGYFRYTVGKESGSWPVVRGKVTYARVQTRRSNKRTEYTASVRYSYRVDGKLHIGERVSVSDLIHKTRSRANAAIRPYPVGSEVDVYYNPAKPEQSLLETGLPTNVYLLLGSGIFCILIAVAVTVSVIKKGSG